MEYPKAKSHKPVHYTIMFCSPSSSFFLQSKSVFLVSLGHHKVPSSF